METHRLMHDSSTSSRVIEMMLVATSNGRRIEEGICWKPNVSSSKEGQCGWQVIQLSFAFRGPAGWTGHRQGRLHCLRYASVLCSVWAAPVLITSSSLKLVEYKPVAKKVILEVKRNKLYRIWTGRGDGGGFFLTRKGSGRTFDKSFSTCTFFFLLNGDPLVCTSFSL